MKKAFIFSLIFLSSFLLSGCGIKKQVNSPNQLPGAEPTPLPTKPLEQTVKEGPFITLLPSADTHWLTLEIKNIAQKISSLEYDLTYFAEVEGNQVERGVGTAGRPEEIKNQTEFSKKILLGSASCTTGTCKYKYDEGVKEGTLSVSLNNTAGKDKYESAFRLQKGKEAKEGLTAGDGVFSFVSENLAPNGAYLTLSTVGVPVSLPSGITPKSAPYGIFSVSPVKKGNIVFKTSLSGVSVYAFDGRTWSKLATEVANGQAKAASLGQYLFILVE